jgi:predicted ribosomally synthesized peptide with nif11-like leader
MSAEAAAALFQRLESDAAFREQVESAATPAEKHRIVTEAGYDVTPDDAPTMRELAGMSELSDDELEAIAAGIATGTGLALGIVGAGAAAAVAAAIV